MESYVFDLHLPNYEVLRFYQGHVKNVRVRDYDGRMVEFSFEHVLPWATRSGITGTFVLDTDETGRFVRIGRLE